MPFRITTKSVLQFTWRRRTVDSVKEKLKGKFLKNIKHLFTRRQMADFWSRTNSNTFYLFIYLCIYVCKGEHDTSVTINKYSLMRKIMKQSTFYKLSFQKMTRYLYHMTQQRPYLTFTLKVSYTVI